MGKTEVRPLSGRGTDIVCSNHNNGKKIIWGKTIFFIPNDLIDKILNEYFVDADAWYPLGADMIKPIPGGLGEFVKNEHPNFSPRHATVIAAIMHHEKLITFKNAKPILLKRMCESI